MERIINFSEYDLTEYESKNDDSIDFYEETSNIEIEKIDIKKYDDSKKIVKGFEYCKSIRKLLDKFNEEVKNLKKQNDTLKKENEELAEEKKKLKTNNNTLSEKLKKIEKDVKEKEDNIKILTEKLKNSNNDKPPVKPSANLDNNTTGLKSLENEIISLKADRMKLNSEINSLKEENTKFKEERVNLDEQIKKYSSALYCNLALLNEYKYQNQNLLNTLMSSFNNKMESTMSKTIENLNEKILILENEIKLMKEVIPKELWELPKMHTEKIIDILEVRKIEAEHNNKLYLICKKFFDANSCILKDDSISFLSEELNNKNFDKMNEKTCYLLENYFDMIDIDKLYTNLKNKGLVEECVNCGNLQRKNLLNILDCGCYICKNHRFSLFDVAFHKKNKHK